MIYKNADGSVSRGVVLEEGGAAIGAANPLVVSPAPTGFTSRSVTTVAGASTPLFGANAARKYLAFQAPQSAGLWINRLGGTAGANLADNFYFAPGTFYESGNAVNTGAMTYWCATAGLVIAAVEG